MRTAILWIYYSLCAMLASFPAVAAFDASAAYGTVVQTLSASSVWTFSMLTSAGAESKVREWLKRRKRVKTLTDYTSAGLEPSDQRLTMKLALLLVLGFGAAQAVASVGVFSLLKSIGMFDQKAKATSQPVAPIPPSPAEPPPVNRNEPFKPTFIVGVNSRQVSTCLWIQMGHDPELKVTVHPPTQRRTRHAMRPTVAPHVTRSMASAHDLGEVRKSAYMLTFAPR